MPTVWRRFIQICTRIFRICLLYTSFFAFVVVSNLFSQNWDINPLHKVNSWDLSLIHIFYRHIREEHICGPGGRQIRIEMFCHGALCMAVSGKCYLSLHEMNHSANRGACMQVCRRSYTVRDKETDVELDIDNQYIMSPKDLKTIHFMNKMMDAGVRVFKIEGRARGPEYVRTVVECYKEAIRSYLEDTFTDEKIAVWDERLKTVFNRGFWNGYYLGPVSYTHLALPKMSITCPMGFFALSGHSIIFTMALSPVFPPFSFSLGIKMSLASVRFSVTRKAYELATSSVPTKVSLARSSISITSPSASRPRRFA